MPHSLNRVSAVLVTYNSAGVVYNALKSVRGCKQVFLVDNASRDATCEVVKEACPEAVVLRQEKNLGFGRGNNVALAKVTTEFALLVNPDAVMLPGSIEALVAAADAYPDAAIIAPAMEDNDGKLHRSFKRNVFGRTKKRDVFVMPEGSLCADFVSGAVMLWRMEAFRKIGFFDDNIFLFFEDDDICLRAKQAGYSVLFVPEARTVHLQGKSTPASLRTLYFKSWHMGWASCYMEKKWKARRFITLYGLGIACLQALKALGYGLIGRKDKATRSAGRMMGVFAFLVGKGSVQ